MRLDGQAIRILVDRVVFTQEETRVNCDSSVFYRSENKMDAFGNIRIVDDSTVITSDKLTYEGDSRVARLRENVIYKEGQREMYTEFLDYDLDKEIANYQNGGKLLDQTNTLTSQTGYFYSQEKYAIFWNEVVLVSPDFTLKTDTLKYNTETKVAYTEGFTEIIKEDSTTLYSKGGVFRTYIDQSQFIEGNVETRDYYLEGDQLFFDDLNRYYKAIGNVHLTSKENDVIIIGDEGYYDKQNGISKIFGNPIMKRVLEKDTFYLAADTLVSIESEIDSLKRILAYPGIRIFKENLQGRSDSAAYFLHDSLIYMYFDPILWTDENQITADTINMEVKGNSIDKMNLRQRSFMISQDNLNNFNQIKGRNMTAYFEGNYIDKIDVDGNGETIFYLLEKGDSVVLGMNRLLCSDLSISLDENDISTITVYKEPEGKIIPPHELNPEDERLAGFTWRMDERPELEDIFNKKNVPVNSETIDSDNKEESNSGEPLINKGINRPKGLNKPEFKKGKPESREN